MPESSGPSCSLPVHVFVSYSQHDADFVHRLRKDVEQFGIRLWVDSEGIGAGTKNWEESIRAAVGHAYGVLAVCSQHAATSVFVQAELDIAASAELDVIPVWIAGEHWISSAPLSLARAQYVDMRAAVYANGLLLLRSALEKLIATKKPQHCWLSSSPIPQSADEVYSYIIVSWGPLGGETTGRVVIDPSAFTSLQHLLDTLYREYLRDIYPPASYGSDWVLGQLDNQLNPRRLLVPGTWLRPRLPQAVWGIEASWTQSTLSSLGVVEGTSWIAQKPLEEDKWGHSLWNSAYAVCLNNRELFDELMTGSGKPSLTLHQRGLLRSVDLCDVAPSDLRMAR